MSYRLTLLQADPLFRETVETVSHSFIMPLLAHDLSRGLTVRYNVLKPLQRFLAAQSNRTFNMQSPIVEGSRKNVHRDILPSSGLNRTLIWFMEDLKTLAGQGLLAVTA